MKKFSVIMCVVALLAFGSGLFMPQAAAQAVYGSIFGTITDPSGAAVAGAKVTVTSATKGTTYETTTNTDGNYSVTHLIPDVYNIRAEGAGFKAFETKNIVSPPTPVRAWTDSFRSAALLKQSKSLANPLN